MIEAEPTMLHPSDSIFVDRTALLQGLTVLRNAAADRTGEEAILSFEESSLVVEFGGGAVTIPTFGGWHLQIRVTGQTLLKLATVMPDRDPIELEVLDGGGHSLPSSTTGIKDNRASGQRRVRGQHQNLETLLA